MKEGTPFFRHSVIVSIIALREGQPHRGITPGTVSPAAAIVRLFPPWCDADGHAVGDRERDYARLGSAS